MSKAKTGPEETDVERNKRLRKTQKENEDPLRGRAKRENEQRKPEAKSKCENLE